MIIRIFFYIIIFDLSHGQSITGNDLLSDLQNSNKNFVYSYWIGMVNGNIQGYEYGIWYALDQFYKDGKINNEERNLFLKHFNLSFSNDLDEEDIFKIVWKYINKNPDIRHMQLSELIPMALSE
tara:strand:+ start:1136 stop:1507 length:372 start_codon:yes stop_codon:yes gene_type:complete